MLRILSRGRRAHLRGHAQGERHCGGDGAAGDVQAGEEEQALHHHHGRAGCGVHVRLQREAVGLRAESGKHLHQESRMNLGYEVRFATFPDVIHLDHPVRVGQLPSITTLQFL